MFDVTKSCTGLQDRLMDFSVNKYRKFMDTVSDSTVQLAFKKLTLVAF